MANPGSTDWTYPAPRFRRTAYADGNDLAGHRARAFALRTDHRPSCHEDTCGHDECQLPTHSQPFDRGQVDPKPGGLLAPQLRTLPAVGSAPLPDNARSAAKSASALVRAANLANLARLRDSHWMLQLVFDAVLCVLGGGCSVWSAVAGAYSGEISGRGKTYNRINQPGLYWTSVLLLGLTGIVLLCMGTWLLVVGPPK